MVTNITAAVGVKTLSHSAVCTVQLNPAVNIQGSWKVSEFSLENFLDMESPGNLLTRSWKVLEFARQ